MAHRKFDSVSQIATGTGAGALLLGLASDERFRTLQAAGMADGDTTEVRIQHESVRAEWEDVLIARSGNSITRTFDARASSATGALINFSAGNKIVTPVARAGSVVTLLPGKDTVLSPALRATRANYVSLPHHIPADNTAPQIGQGDRLFSRSFTANDPNSQIEVIATVRVATEAAADKVTIALFIDGAAAAVESVTKSTSGADAPMDLSLNWAGTLAAVPHTFEVRCGGAVRTVWLNGISMGRIGGGAQKARLNIDELPSLPPPPPPAPSLRQIATRSDSAITPFTSLHYLNSRCFSQARAAMVNPVIVFSNWYGDEVAVGAATVKFAIEYPAGVFTQGAFAASTSGALPGGATDLASDPVPVTIPNGAGFWIRIFWNSAAGIVLTDKLDSTLGDACEYSASALTDKSMGGTITSTDGNNLYRPTYILGVHAGPAVMIWGDSINKGQGDSVSDHTGYQGLAARSIGPNFAYSNVAKNGEKLSDMLTLGALRTAAAHAWHTHVLTNTGINDFHIAHTADQVESDANAVCTMLAPAKVFWNTVTPYVDPTGINFSNLVDQVVQEPESTERCAFNDRLRGGFVTGVAGYFEAADACESSRNSGKWKVNGTPYFQTTDGLHKNQSGYIDFAASGAIDPGQITSTL